MRVTPGGIVALIIALLAATIGIVTGWQTATFTSRAIKTEALIVRMGQKYNSKGTLRTYPIYEYRDASGHRWQGDGVNNLPFSVGQKIAIYYDPHYPMESTNDMSYARWWVTVVSSLIALGAAAFAWDLMRTEDEADPPHAKGAKDATVRTR